MVKLKDCFILLFYFHCAQVIVNSTSVEDSPEDALSYIKELQKKVNSTRDSNIILVIGYTGCGKSTLVHYVAGDYSKMLAVDSSNPNSVDLEIRDGLDPDKDRITLSTESRTLVPVISVDETHNVWVDSPGFGDTCNEVVEIATTFLIKRTIENASNIKIVLVANYDSVTNGNSRGDFDNLLSRATELVKNIERFENSVSLVVTKAPSFKMRGRRIIDIFEDSIKNTTAQFLIDHRSVLEKKGTFANKIQLIDALLKQNASLSWTKKYFPKISIFWRPNETGPLDKIGKMIAGRQSIRESILKHSSYAQIQINDFGFPLTPQAQMKVIGMVQHSVNSISATLQQNTHRLINEIQRLIQSALTVKGRLEIIEIGMDCIQTQNIERTITLNQIVDQLMLLNRAYNVPAGMEDLNRIEQNQKSLYILNSLIEADKNSTDLDASHSKSSNSGYHSFLEQVIDFLNNNKNETQKEIVQKAKEMTGHISTTLMNFDNQLLQALQRKFQSIKGFQNRIKLFRCGNNSMYLIEKETTLRQRIEQLKNLTHANEIRSINMSVLNYLNRNEKELTELKMLAESEVQLPVRDWIYVSSKAINYQLSMYDWSLFLEETYQYFGEYENLNRSSVAPIIDENNFNEITKRIRRSAEYEPTSNKITEMNEIINITMQYPSYECDGSTFVIKGHFVKSSDIQNAIVTKCSSLGDLTTIQVFVLDTFYVDSDLHLNKTKEVELRIMAPTWNIRQKSTFNLNGIDGERHNGLAPPGSAGMHGNPGTNGGNFIGWANDIINGDWLSVELNGGRGGNGQDGAGSSDVVVTFERIEFSDTWKWGFSSIPDGINNYYLQFFIKNGYKPEVMSSRKTWSDFGLTASTFGILQTFKLLPDGCCGSAGAGGEGGIGGLGGDSDLIFSNNKTKFIPKIVSNGGENGDAGINGRYCDTSELQLSIYSIIKKSMGRRDIKSEFFNKVKNHYDDCPVQRGLVFNIGRPKPSVNQLHGPLNIVQAIIEYKSFLLENMDAMHDPANIVQKTYDLISSDPAIKCSMKDFAIEANILERSFPELVKHIDVLPFYDDLLKRIENFSVENNVNLSNVDKKIFELTYTMLFSKTRSMQSSHASDLIVDIGKFLELTAQNIDELNELKRVNVINKQRDEYKNVLMTKIQEATNFINDDMNPEIERTTSLLNIELKKAVDETIELQSKTVHEIRLKEEKLQIIQSNVKKRKVLDILETILKILGCFCGKAIPCIGNIVVDKIRKNLVDPEISKFEVPSGIQHLRNTMHKNGREKIEATEIELKNLKISLQKYYITNHEPIKHLNEYIANITEMKSISPVATHAVTNLIEKCTKFLNGWQNEYSSSNDHNKVSIVRSIRRAQHALTVITSSFPTYQQISRDGDAKINEVVRAMNEDHETLETLKIFEDGIYSELMPMVDEMYEYLANVQENLVNRSSVVLDVTSWKVKKTLRNVQTKLIGELAQFKVEGSINDIMTRINEAIKLTIDIYDRIQNYQGDSKLATFLSSLHTAKDMDIDANSEKILNGLEMSLQSNLILGQYFRVLGAFKQSVFPYAASYLDEYVLLSSSVNDSTSLITLASQQIKSLSKRLVEYNDTVISENDEFIHSAFFNRDNGSRGPFYAWPNSEVRDRIQQLFEGKTIYLLADVHKSDSRNAVKFNKIELEFHSDNQTADKRLFEILQTFHVSLTHLGNSNYRCNNTFYTIPSRPWNIKYSIAERNQSPVDQNSINNKLNAGSSLLSPYTLWSVQLLYGQFDQLIPFADFVDIELHGFGLYVEENAPICETNLEKYYSVMGNW